MAKFFALFAMALLFIPGLVYGAEPEYGKDCSVYYFWNYLIDDCNFRLNSIYFVIPILIIVIVISVIFFYSIKSKIKLK